MRIFRVSKKNGKITYDKTGMSAHIESLPDGDYEWVIREAKRYRTDDQNRLYWDLLGELEDYTGEEKGKWHILFKRMFLPEAIKYKDKVLGFTTSSSRDIDKKDFSNYYTQCSAWIAEKLPDFIFPFYLNYEDTTHPEAKTMDS